MSSSRRNSSQDPTAINKFIRPTSKLDTTFTAELASNGAGLATSDEVAAAIREGVAAKLADAMMAALGSHFECLSNEDVHTLVELYTAAPSAASIMADAVVVLDGEETLAK